MNEGKHLSRGLLYIHLVLPKTVFKMIKLCYLLSSVTGIETLQYREKLLNSSEENGCDLKHLVSNQVLFLSRNIILKSAITQNESLNNYLIQDHLDKRDSPIDKKLVFWGSPGEHLFFLYIHFLANTHKLWNTGRKIWEETSQSASIWPLTQGFNLLRSWAYVPEAPNPAQILPSSCQLSCPSHRELYIW